MKNPDINLTDTEIIEKILKGEPALYELLIRRYNSFLYRIGRAYRYDHQYTEDLMQETYVSAYYNLKAFENRAAFKTWLARIMLHHCYQKKQKFSYQKETTAVNELSEKSFLLFHQQVNTEKTVMNKELGHVIEAALGRIPVDYRMVFTFRELNGLTVSETAGVLHISESNVKTRLNRAKTMLRSEISKMYLPGDIFEFNLVYCDGMVERVMRKIGRRKSIKNGQKHAP